MQDSTSPPVPAPHAARRRRPLCRRLGQLGAALLGLALLWVGACIVEVSTGHRLLPWNPYASCGDSAPATLPGTVQVGLYEEFPNPWRLARLRQVDFPVTLAVAAPSRAAFLDLRAQILHEYPQVREVYFWPLLSYAEGYYLGTWSDAAALRRAAADSADMSVLWDLELPLGMTPLSARSWPHNRAFLDGWLRERSAPVHIWRSHSSMGLDPLFLRLIAMHYDPRDYPAVWLHLDLYTTGEGLPPAQMARTLRCGVEHYGPRFVPSLGVLDDGEGASSQFVPPETLRRDLRLAREAGVAQVWLFGVNGLNSEYLAALRETLPLETLPLETLPHQIRAAAP